MIPYLRNTLWAVLLMLPLGSAIARVSYLPSTGDVYVPVILVSFSDLSFTLDSAAVRFDDFYNGHGGSNPSATGSVSDYYRASSNNALHLHYDVYGPYTLSGTTSYYGSNSESSHNKNARALVAEAVQLAYDEGVDFSRYDNNNDGLIDNVSIVVAGHNEAEGADAAAIWPHYSSFGNSALYGSVRISGYLMISEYRGASGTTQAGIGTYCHEFGHALGLPDFYDTKHNGDQSDDALYTIGSWSIMCNGSYNNTGCTPPTYTAFERFCMGWLTPTQLSQAASCTLQPIESSNSAYLLAAKSHNCNALSPSPTEYFLLENRQRTGWDALHKSALVGTGMLVSHITWNKSTWDANTFNTSAPFGFDIAKAVSRDASEANASDAFPGPRGVTVFCPVLNSGDSLSALRLSNIYEHSDGHISFLLGDYQGANLKFSADELPILTSHYDGKLIDREEAQLTLTGKGLTAPTVTVSVPSDYFDFTADSVWIKKGTDFTDSVAADGTYQRTFRVRYTPRRQSCTPVAGRIVAQTSDGTCIAQTSLRGQAPRPTYIATPDSLCFSDITPTSAALCWKSQPDADEYHLVLYKTRIASGDTTYTELSSRVVFAPTACAFFSDLQPGSTYAVTVSAFEAKGCEPHLTPASSPCHLRLRSGNARTELQVCQEADGQYVLLLTEPLLDDMLLHVYLPDGQLLTSHLVHASDAKILIPTDEMQPGSVYLLKLSSQDKLRRNDSWARFLYVK